MRKIIKAGETSFAVILPKAWLRFYNIKNGDSIRMISNGTVTIEPLTQKDKQKGAPKNE